MAKPIPNPHGVDNSNTSGSVAGDIIVDPIDPASLIAGGIVSEIPIPNEGTNTKSSLVPIPSSSDSSTAASSVTSQDAERSIPPVPAPVTTTPATTPETQPPPPIAQSPSSSRETLTSPQPVSSTAPIIPPTSPTSTSPSSSRTPTPSSSPPPSSTRQPSLSSPPPSSTRQPSSSSRPSSKPSSKPSSNPSSSTTLLSFSPASTFRTSTKTSESTGSTSTGSTSTPALGNSSTPAPEATVSPSQNHRNIAAIAAPVAVGVFLCAILIMIFCCWRRSRSFGGSNHRRRASSDSEMSSVVPYNQGVTYEPKSTNPRSPEPFLLSARQAPTFPQRPDSASQASSQRNSEHGEIQSISSEPTYNPGTLPGLGENSAPVSPLGQTFAPPPYRRSKQTDSPSAQSSSSAETIEPLDIIRSSKRNGWLRRSADMRGSGSKRHSSFDRENIEWPLPSPTSDMTPGNDGDNPFSRPQMQMRMASGGLSREYSKSKSPWPMPPTGIPRRGDSVAGPSTPRPAGGVKLVSNNNSDSYRNSRQSPFDDTNTNTNTGPLNSRSSSPYTHSDESEGQHRWSTMLQVPQPKTFNDDGISEFSIQSGHGSRRGGSRLHYREADEVSIVSSLNDKDREEGSGGSGDASVEKEKRTRDQTVTALPGFGE